MEFVQPGVNIIMVTYGMPEMCVNTIKSIYNNTDYHDFDITVIDNHSLDDTWGEVCKELYKHPDTASGLQSHENLGYAKACNIGALITSKPLILFLNSDAYPIPEYKDWLTNLVDTIMDGDDIGVVAPKLVNRDGLIMGSGVRGTNKDRYIKDFMKPDKGQCDTPLDVLSVCGACMLVKRDIFMGYGGFDEAFKFYFEEEDFCWRIRHDGLRIRYEPSSVVIHDHQGSCKDQQLLSGFAGESQMIFMSKWYQWMEEDKTVYDEGE